MLIFELFEGLVEIMCVICWKNISCYIILIICKKILIYLKKIYEIIWNWYKLYEKTMKLYEIIWIWYENGEKTMKLYGKIMEKWYGKTIMKKFKSDT